MNELFMAGSCAFVKKLLHPTALPQPRSASPRLVRQRGGACLQAASHEGFHLSWRLRAWDLSIQPTTWVYLAWIKLSELGYRWIEIIILFCASEVIVLNLSESIALRKLNSTARSTWVPPKTNTARWINSSAQISGKPASCGNAQRMLERVNNLFWGGSLDPFRLKFP